MGDLKFHRISRLPDIRLDLCSDNSPLPTPAAGQLHIWKVDLDQTYNEATRLHNYKWLSDYEQQRLGRYRPGVIRNNHAAALFALRSILSHYLHCPPLEIRYQYGQHGKPELVADCKADGLCFNSTDSRGLALIAVAKDMNLGIDLEYLDRQIRSVHLADRICGSVESAQLQHGEEPRRQLLQCWTRKEAWGKALGTGIRYPLSSIPVCIGLSWKNCRIFSSHGDWQLLTLQPEQDWLVSVVAGEQIDNIQYRSWQTEPDEPNHPVL